MLINTSSDLEIFRTRIGASQDARFAEKLVAVTGADGDLVTALGAAAVENGGASLGLHAAQKAVGLGAAAAVGLKGALRHGTDSWWAGVRLPELFAIAAISDYTS